MEREEKHEGRDKPDVERGPDTSRPAGGSLCFEDLRVGDQWTSRGRTVTETDVVNFAGLTGDFDPLHVDHEYARSTPFGRPIAHGLLGVSLVAGLGSHSPSVKTVAFVAMREWEFLRPIYVGDTVHVHTEVKEIRPSGRRSGHVAWKRQLINQNGRVVQAGVFETLVATAKFQEKRRRQDPHASGPAKPHAASEVAPTDQT